MSIVDLSVSVIINNYNYGCFLAEAIESALNQTVPPCEVIVVDDGSTDNSKEVIATYKNKVHAVLQRNAGQQSAYNVGFQASKGDLIYFLDADDRMNPEMIAEVLKVWKPGAAKLHFPLQIINEQGELSMISVPTAILGDGDLADEILRTGYYTSPPASGNVYGREALQKTMPLPETSKYFADMYTIYLTPFHGEVLAIHTPLGQYRVHSSNNSAAAASELRAIRDTLQADYIKVKMLKAMAQGLKETFDEGCVNYQLHHLKLRLSSLRLDPQGHPCEHDQAIGLAFRGMRAALIQKQLPISKRLLLMVWFMLLSFVPTCFVAFFVAIGMRPSSRQLLPAWTKWLTKNCAR